MNRLTKKIENPQYSNDYDMLCAHEYHVLNKLGKIEDIMEKYEIKSIEELEEIIADYDDMCKDIVEMTFGEKVEIR